MKKRTNLKKPVCALATLTLTASLMLPGVSSAAENTAIDGSYTLNNSSYLTNTGWTGSNGSRAVAGETTTDQSIFYDNAASFGYNWMYPADATGVQSSPAISFGWNWSNGYEGAGNMPVEIVNNNNRRSSSNSSSSSSRNYMQNIDTSVAYSTSDVTGEYAIGYTAFIHNTQWAGSMSDPQAKIKIITSTSANGDMMDDTSMTDASNTMDTANRTETSTANDTNAASNGTSGDQQATSTNWGQWLDTVDIDGSTWNVYRTDNNNMQSSLNMDGTEYTFVRTANTDMISLNITDFVQMLLNRGELNATNNGGYISGVKFGTDVMSGSGKLTVSDWNISVQ